MVASLPSRRRSTPACHRGRVPECPPLETARLHLRPWSATDLDGLARVFAEPAVWRYPFGRGLDRDETGRFLQRELRRWDALGFGTWAAELKTSGELVGYIGLGVPDWLPEVMPAVDIGWRIHPDHWGHGLATEGGRRAVRHGFETVAVDRLLCLHDGRNRPSARVAAKLGFRVEHNTVGPGFGEPVTVRALTREDWESTQAVVRPATNADLARLIVAMGGREFFEDRFERQARGNGAVLVAVVGGRIVGDVYVSFEPAWEEELRVRLPGVPSLTHLEVAEAHQRQGIATRLLAAAEAEAARRGAAAVFLGVEPGNEAARRLYERLGYLQWEHGLVATGWWVVRDGRRVEYRTTIHVLVKPL